MRLDVAPIAGVTPIHFETAIGVWRILLRVLLPVRIVVPDGEGLRHVLGLNSRKKLIHAMLLRPVPEIPGKAREHEHGDEARDQNILALACLGRIVSGCIEQGHAVGSAPRLSRKVYSDRLS